MFDVLIDFRLHRHRSCLSRTNEEEDDERRILDIVSEDMGVLQQARRFPARTLFN